MAPASLTTAFIKRTIAAVFFTLLLIAPQSNAYGEPDTRVVQVYPQLSHTFILTEDGSLWACGDNRDGKLGDGTNTNRTVPVKIVLDNVTALYPQSSGHTFALKDDGTLWAWERNWDGRIGTGREALSHPEPVRILDRVDRLYPHERHSFALKTDGTLWGWGNNSHGQLGDGTTINRFTPVRVNLKNVQAVFPMNNSTYALQENGTLWAWGHNQYGKLGDGSTANRSIPARILEGVEAVYPLNTHTLALKSDKTLWAWGHNWYGQLGDGTGDNRYRPVQVNIDLVEEVYPQKYHSFALKEDGSLWAWGYNWHGQLGDGTILNRTNPVQVRLKGVTELYPRHDHTLAITENNSLWAWGRNGGSLPGNSESAISNPLPVKIREDVQQAFALERHAYALDTGGRPIALGNNETIVPGHSEDPELNTPGSLPLENVIKIFPQDKHAFALKEDGSLWAWGDNTKGQLGIGNFTSQPEPAQVLLGSDLPAYAITLTTHPEGSGVLSGAGTYRRGESVNIEVLPNPTYTFVNWTEDGEEISTDSNLSFLASGDRHLMANFETSTREPEVTEPEELPVFFDIALSTEPEEGGTVSGGGEYEKSAAITVIAEAAENYTFTSWTEDGEIVSSTAEYRFTATADRELVANFDPAGEEDTKLFDITLSTDPEEGGTVSGGGEYEKGAEAAVQAKAAEGYSFVRWIETLPGEEDIPGENYSQVSDRVEYRFTVDRDRTLTAAFELIEEEKASAQISSIRADNGVIAVVFDRELEGLPPAGDFAALYLAEPLPDENIEINGPAENGPEDDWSAFENIRVSWSDEDAARAILLFDPFPQMEREINYTARVSFRESDAVEAQPFTVEALEPVFMLDLETEPADSGTVTGDGSYFEGEEVDIGAAAAEGYHFVNWTAGDEEISGAAEFVFNMPAAAVTLKANFEKLPSRHTLSLTADPEKGGTVSGEGEFAAGDEATVHAEPAEGYRFVNWARTDGDSENGETPAVAYTTVSEEASYSFTIEHDLALTAFFEETGEEEAPAAINSLSAENGAVTVFFNRDLEASPRSEDFSVLYQAEEVTSDSTGTDPESGTEPETGWSAFSEKSVSWRSDEADRAVITFPPFDKKEVQISYTLKIGYLESDPLEAGPFTVEALSPFFELTLFTDPPGSGTVSGGGLYHEGETVAVSATAGGNYEFAGWSLDNAEVSESAEFEFTMPAEDTVLTAHFPEIEPDLYEVTLLADPAAGGTVSSGGLFEEGAVITLEAVPAPGYIFIGWAENDKMLGFDPTFEYTVAAENATLLAIFDPEILDSGNGENGTQNNHSGPANYSPDASDPGQICYITVSSDPAGSGRVKGEGYYEQGDQALIIAEPPRGYIFCCWLGNDSIAGFDEELVFTVTTDLRLTAVFEPVENTGPQEEQVNSEADEYGEESDTPAPAGDPGELPKTYTITLTVEPEDGGEVEGDGQYTGGDIIGLNAIPAEGYEFTGWLEGGTEVSIAKAYAFIVDRDRELVAGFAPLLNRQNEKAETYSVRLAPVPLDGGRVYGSSEYTEGKTITVSALPNIDYIFSSWTEDGEVVSTDVIYTFTVDRDYQLSANFMALNSDSSNDLSGCPYEFERFLHTYFAGFPVLSLPLYGEGRERADHFGFTNIARPPAGGGIE